VGVLATAARRVAALDRGWRAIGVAAFTVFTSTPPVPAGATQELTNAYRLLFLLAFAGLGLDIDIGELRAAGLEPVAIVLAALLTASVVTLSVPGLLFSA